MTRSLALRNIYVEGDDDRDILSPWFPHLQFEATGGKDKVRSTVDKDQASYGLLDRDFAAEHQVATSRESHSRITIMRRYCVENYLLEPVIIIAAVNQLMPVIDSLRTWLDEALVRQMLHQWAGELALYAAANSIISEWRGRIMFDQELGFLRYFGPLPPLPQSEVVASLKRRLASLTSVDQIEAVLTTRHSTVTTEMANWDGLHRWISGKVLLEKYVYPYIFESVGLSQVRTRDLLIEAGQQHVPAELQELAQRWAA